MARSGGDLYGGRHMLEACSQFTGAFRLDVQAGTNTHHSQKSMLRRA
jgi:hypothetical protein